MKPENEKTQRVIAFLNREDVDYLDTIGKNSLFTKGVKLSRIKIIRAMIEAIRDMKIDGKDIGSQEELKEAILKKVAELAARNPEDK